MELSDILQKYAVPDPSIVSQLPKGGIMLDFVGHADITRILIEIDPMWTWEPCGWALGRPDIHIENGIATMWGRLTLLGKTMIGVGSARADKADYEKELIGDLIRNISMRYGISLSLWTKSGWEDLGGTQKPAGRPQSSGTTQSASSSSGDSASDAQLRMIRALGHSDAMPTTKAAASALITQLKNKVTSSDEGAF
jgi:hypothetical protein